MINLKKYTDDKLSEIDWTKYKIVAETESDKEQLMEAFRHIHDSDVDTDYITVNQLSHEYLDINNIVVGKELYHMISTLNKNT